MTPAEVEVASRPLREVQFRLHSLRVRGARRIAIAGSFNDWSDSKDVLSLRPDGWWMVTLTLPPGAYLYLSLVDGFPFNDPDDDGRIPNAWGGEYSLRRVP